MRYEGRSSLDVTIGNDGPGSFSIRGQSDIFFNLDDTGQEYFLANGGSRFINNDSPHPKRATRATDAPSP